MMKTQVSEKLFAEAKKYIPGGVNSPVRAFQAVGGTPPFIKRADGCRIYDEDGNEYIDYIGSWGPMILGSNHPEVRKAVEQVLGNGLSFGACTEAEVKMAKLIVDTVPSIEMIRMVNSGTEATMSALRAARGYTGRSKVIKFEGCYHGHSDSFLVKAGSGLMTGGLPDSAGVPPGCVADTLSAVYNDFDSVEQLFSENPGQIAALIIEPVAANMGVVLPKEGFLKQLREICSANGTVLIFDEVITGFRLSLTGAAGYYGVEPDLTTYGKIIGAGMPVGAYGGKKEIMEVIAPSGNVYQAGTLSGNPVAMAAGFCQLSWLAAHPEVYTHLEALGQTLFCGLLSMAEKAGAACSVNHVGSLGSLFFTRQSVTDYALAKTSDTNRFADYFNHMLNQGIYLAPSQFEAMFLSYAHGDKEIGRTLEAAETFFKK